jgi:dihydroneopterin aldolase|tara:strand:- start:15 stop:383 length:369 start_codon:yes stop_codon:yes gene_type:complete
MRTTVKVENLKIYAFHGCMNEEKVIGSDYVVNITAICFVNKEVFQDVISGTVDYVDLARIAKQEMSIRAKLLEVVVKRIIDRSFEEITVLNKISVTVSKINPPINADVEAVSVTMAEERKSQ